MSLFTELVAAGVPVSNHESDLYIPITTAAQEILQRHPLQQKNATRFISQVDGGPMFDVPFAYDPYWAATTVLKAPTTLAKPEGGMSRFRAEAYLRRLGAHEKIADIYDDDELLRSALLSLITGFEYPDWSYRTVGEVLKKVFKA